MDNPFSTSTRITTSANIGTQSVLIVDTNPSRKGLIVWNNSANSIYLAFGPTCSSAACTAIVATFTSWTYAGPIIYQGPISGIRNAGTGTVTITELQ